MPKFTINFAVQSADGRMTRYPFEGRDRVFKIGKLTSSHIRIEDPDVSRMHAIVEFTGDVAEVIDMSSFSGTFLNGVKINKARLKTGDVLRVGNTTITVTIKQKEVPVTDDPTEPPKTDAASTPSETAEEAVTRHIANIHARIKPNEEETKKAVAERAAELKRTAERTVDISFVTALMYDGINDVTRHVEEIEFAEVCRAKLETLPQSPERDINIVYMTARHEVATRRLPVAQDLTTIRQRLIEALYAQKSEEETKALWTQGLSLGGPSLASFAWRYVGSRAKGETETTGTAEVQDVPTEPMP